MKVTRGPPNTALCTNVRTSNNRWCPTWHSHSGWYS